MVEEQLPLVMVGFILRMLSMKLKVERGLYKWMPTLLKLTGKKDCLKANLSKSLDHHRLQKVHLLTVQIGKLKTILRDIVHNINLKIEINQIK